MPDEYVLDVGTHYVRVNYVDNPSFESGTTDWTAVSVGLTSVTTTPYTGSRCAQMTLGTVTTSRIYTDPIAATGLGPFRASCWVKNTAGVTRNHRISVSWGTGRLDGPDVSVAAGSDWTYLEVSGTYPDDALQPRVEIFHQRNNANTGNVTLVDAVMLEGEAAYFWPIPTDTFFFGPDDISKVPNDVANVLNRTDFGRIEYDRFTSDLNLVSATVFAGNRTDVDPPAASTGTFEIWYPDGFTNPEPTLVPGAPVRLRRVGKTASLWEGMLRDIRVTWDFPWTGTVGNGDRLQLTAEGYLSAYQQALSEGSTNPLTVSEVLDWLAGYFVYGQFSAATGYDPVMAPTFETYTADAEVFQLIAQTYNATIDDTSRVLHLKAYNLYDQAGSTFSDAANSANVKAYEEITYTSSADNLITEVRVQSDVAIGDQYVAATYPGQRRTITTLSGNNDQAQGLANDLIDRYGVPEIRVASVACRAEAQHTMNLDGLATADSWHDLIGKRTTVTFRGTTQEVRIQGIELVASPETALYRYYFSAENPVEYFILDSSDYGVLDTNRLGW